MVFSSVSSLVCKSHIREFFNLSNQRRFWGMQNTLCKQEVAERLGVSERTLTTWRHNGTLVPEIIYPSKRSRYTEQQIEEFESRLYTSKK